MAAVLAGVADRDPDFGLGVATFDQMEGVGCGVAAAFVARPGMVLDPLAPRPDIVGADLGEVAEQIAKTDTP